MRTLSAACLAGVLFASVNTSVRAEGDPAKGKTNFLICMGCHGMNGEGNKALNAPMNGGQLESYLVRQLENFRAGIRGTHAKDLFGMQMRPMAMALPNEQAVEDVAAYLASLKPPPAAATVTGDVDKGEALYNYCFACHGEKGEGNELFASPKLAGQHDWYLVRQLKNFRKAIRGGKEEDKYGVVMHKLADKVLNDDNINDLVAYINTLKPE